MVVVVAAAYSGNAMKSSNTSISPLRRALVAATVVLATGSVAALAQSPDQPSSTNATPSTGSSYNQSNDTSANNANNSSTMESNATATDNNASANNANASSNSSKLDWSDKRFLTKVAKGNEDEIKIAQLATEQASNPDVKSFAQQLVNDHQKMAQDLQSLASNKGVELKGEEKAEKGESHEYKKLAKASGTDFDRQFIENMVSEHKKDVKEFQGRANDAKDADVKSFAQNQLPTLQHHLQIAQQLQQSVVPTGRSGKESWKYSGNATETGSASGTSATGATSNSTNSATSSGAATGATSSGTSSSRTP